MYCYQLKFLIYFSKKNYKNYILAVFIYFYHISAISFSNFLWIFMDYQYVSVKVKWGKELFSNVEVNTEEDPILFKAQLFALTGVQPERQKVMLKGMTLKDDDWGNLKLKDVIYK